MSDKLRELIHGLSEATGDDLPVECVEGTYEIESDHFTLTFTSDSEIFEIHSIDVRGNVGFEHKIINAIHEYSDENDLEVIASNVRDTARGFWEKMGYQEGDSEGEFYRVV